MKGNFVALVLWLFGWPGLMLKISRGRYLTPGGGVS